MQVKTNKKQTLWVLFIAFSLMTLCTLGLWAYVQGADAETGVQETSLAQIPEADRIAYTPEKYDNYPAPKEEDDFVRIDGSGLGIEEIRRLPGLLDAYASGQRPSKKASSLPGEDGLAVIPIDPKEFEGLTEYYILPEKRLSDDQLLMLIDYCAAKGVPFEAGTTTWKNCMRGGYPDSNRYLSAGEEGRRAILLRRLRTEGLSILPAVATLDTLPVSGVAGVRLNREKHRFSKTFHLYPIRELTDDELLQSLYLDYMDGYCYINPEMDASLNPAADLRKVRSFFEQVMNMPASSDNTELVYKRKDATGEIHMHALFKSAMINGVETKYQAIVKMDTGDILWAARIDNISPGSNNVLVQDLTDSNMQDLRWVDIAKAFAPMLTHMKITKASTSYVEYTSEGILANVQASVTLEDGNSYFINIDPADGMITSAQIMHHDLNLVNSFIW